MTHGLIWLVHTRVLSQQNYRPAPSRLGTRAWCKPLHQKDKCPVGAEPKYQLVPPIRLTHGDVRRLDNAIQDIASIGRLILGEEAIAMGARLFSIFWIRLAR